MYIVLNPRFEWQILYRKEEKLFRPLSESVDAVLCELES